MEIQMQKEMDMEREQENYFTYHTSQFWKSYLMQKKIQSINYHLEKCTMSLAVTIQITYFVMYNAHPCFWPRLSEGKNLLIFKLSYLFIFRYLFFCIRKEF